MTRSDDLGRGRLPNAEEPHADESLPGFLKRMGALNGYESAMVMLGAIDPEFADLRRAAFVAHRHEDLAGFLALEEGELERLCYGDGAMRRLMGRDVDRELVAVGNRKACPLCLDEAAYHRASWDVVLLTACPAHAVRLVDRCACGTRFGWRPGPLTHCSELSCLADLRDTVPEPVPADLMGGVRALDRLLRHGGCPEFGGEVAALPVSDQILLVFQLGLMARGHDRVTRTFHFASQRPDELHLILDAGWRACADWPRGFRTILDGRLEQAGGRVGRFGVGLAFGGLYRRIEGAGDAPFARLLRREMADYVVARPDLATRAPDIRLARSAADLRFRHATLGEAMDLLEVGFDRARALADELNLWIVPPSGKGAPALIRADLLHELHAQRSGLLTKADVRQELGVGKKTVDKMREAGLLRATPSEEDPAALVYPREGLDGLLRSLEERVPEGPRRMPRPAVTVAGVARRVSLPGYDSTDVVRAVLEGRITPVALSGRARGLQRLLFREADAERFAAEVMAAERSTMSVVEAASELRVKQEVAYHWVRTGLLATVPGTKDTEAGRRVTKEALRRFTEEYVTGPEVARRLGLAIRWVSVHLQERGVNPVSGPSVDGARQFLFRRAEALAVSKGALVSGHAKRQPVLAARKRLDRNASEGLRMAIAGAVRRETSAAYVQRRAVMDDRASGTRVQVMTAGNIGVGGTYLFRVRRSQTEPLAAAKQGIVALGFADRQDFLLVPWPEFAAHLEGLGGVPEDGIRTVVVRAGTGGTLEPFGQHARPKRPPDANPSRAARSRDRSRDGAVPG